VGTSESEFASRRSPVRSRYAPSEKGPHIAGFLLAGYLHSVRCDRVWKRLEAAAGPHARSRSRGEGVPSTRATMTPTRLRLGGESPRSRTSVRTGQTVARTARTVDGYQRAPPCAVLTRSRLRPAAIAARLEPRSGSRRMRVTREARRGRCSAVVVSRPRTRVPNEFTSSDACAARRGYGRRSATMSDGRRATAVGRATSRFRRSAGKSG
jgi:hypothetical protein